MASISKSYKKISKRFLNDMSLSLELFLNMHNFLELLKTNYPHLSNHELKGEMDHIRYKPDESCYMSYVINYTINNIEVAERYYVKALTSECYSIELENSNSFVKSDEYNSLIYKFPADEQLRIDQICTSRFPLVTDEIKKYHSE